jgi:hypothetical protein
MPKDYTEHIIWKQVHSFYATRINLHTVLCKSSDQHIQVQTMLDDDALNDTEIQFL